MTDETPAPPLPSPPPAAKPAVKIAPVTTRTPRQGDVVLCYPNGNRELVGYVGLVCRVFGKGDPFGAVNVAAFTPEGKPNAMTSVHHASKAPAGQPCWDWPKG